jgi:hypothetical protein
MTTKMLQRPTLVLNRNWQPVNVATVARALVLLWNESARVVDPPTISFPWPIVETRADSRSSRRSPRAMPEVIAPGLRPVARGRELSRNCSSGTTTPANTAARSRAARN